jgi:hypothetical protein
MEDECRCDKDRLKEFKSTLAKMWATAWAAESEALGLFKKGCCYDAATRAVLYTLTLLADVLHFHEAATTLLADVQRRREAAD